MIDNRIKKERFRDDWKGKKGSEGKQEKWTGSTKDAVKDGTSGGVRNGAKNSTRNGVKDSTRNNMKDSAKGSTKNGMRDGAKDSTRNSMRDGAKGSTKNSMRDGAKDRTRNSVRDGAKDSTRNSMRDGAKDSTRNSMRDGAKGSTKNNMKDSAKGSTKNSTKNSMKDGAKSSTKNGMRDGAKSSTKNSMRDGAKGSTKNSMRDGAKNSMKNNMRDGAKGNVKDAVQDSSENRMKGGAKDRTTNKTKNDLRGNSFDRKRHEEENGEKKFQKQSSKCPVFYKCGGCQLLDMPYEKQLDQKQKQLEKLLKPYCKVEPIIGMENPYHYRNKVHAVFDHDRNGNPISGVYEANSHRVVPVESCFIEDQKADEIIGSIRGMLKSFKILTYDEDTGYGLLRHVLIRRGFTTGEIMVVLVTAYPIFPSKNNFVKELRRKHPEITTIIQNINGRDTSMVLGDKENVFYGKGYIEDILCGCRFRISSKSFYQVNPIQTEVLYNLAIKAAGLTGNERVIDAYCGIGTIGIVASKHAKEIIGVELNRDAVRDAVENAKINGIKNVRFFCNDAGKFMVDMAENGEQVDVVFMDPPRSGSTEEFIESVAKINPKKVVYVSCGPETLVRDLEYFKKKGYEAKKGWGIDMFPGTEHVETVCLLSKQM